MPIADWPLLERAEVCVEEMTMPIHARQVIVDMAALLESIRGLHQSVVAETPDDRWLCCNECGQDWPCSTARLIYTEEELA